MGTTGRGRARLRWAAASLVLAPLLAGGCTLVGQRTFVADADRPPHPRPPPAAPVHETPALVVIDFPSPPSDWEGPLRVAVGLAVSRKPNVLFTVQATAPRSGDIEARRAALARAVADATEVASRIVADGVDRGQVEMIAATDPRATGEAVRLTVR